VEREAEDVRRSGDFSEAAAQCLFSVSFELNLGDKEDRTHKEVETSSVSLPRIIFSEPRPFLCVGDALP
jgi:hypothetical protein